MNDLSRLLAIMERLRDPERGCPWDLEQTFATIVPYTIEEAYEVADTIDREAWHALRGELGDLLFQIVFYAQLAREAGLFDFNDIVRGAADKMERRHPHVFGTESVASAAAQTAAWERHKAGERHAEASAGERAPSVLDGVAKALPALSRAIKLQARVARVGFDWPDLGPVLKKLDEELAEIRKAFAEGSGPERLKDELGDLLFVCANLARHLKIDAEASLRKANDKFDRRFRRVEALLKARGKRPEGSTLEEMDRLWEEAKREERR